MMTDFRFLKWWLATMLLAVGVHLSAGQLYAQPQPADPVDGVEVQTRGPVHEAFAGVISFHPEPGATATKAPARKRARDGGQERAHWHIIPLPTGHITKKGR